MSDVPSGCPLRVITDITDMSATVYVNPVGLDPGRFATFEFSDGIIRNGPEAGWYWNASWEAVDTGALAPVCVLRGPDRDR